MIWTSRKRGNSEETIIATAVVITNSAASSGTTSSHDQAGAIPKASTNANATTRFSPRLKKHVTTIDRGMTRRGNCVLRTTPS